MKSWVESLRIKQRIILVFTIVLIVIYAFSAFLLQVTTSKRVIHETNVFATSQLHTLLNIMELAHTKSSSDAFSNSDYRILKKYFDEKVVFEGGYPFLVATNGNVLIHTSDEELNYIDEYFFLRLKNEKTANYFSYKQKEESGKHKYHVYYQYVDFYDAYVILKFKHDVLFKDINRNKIVLLFAVLLILCITALMINVLIDPVIKEIKKVNERLRLLSHGKQADTIDYHLKNELGEIADSFNYLVIGLNNTSRFAKEIGNENYETKYEALSNDDELGTALLEMRDHLKKAKEVDLIRQEEENRNNWAIEGLARFGDILRLNTEDLKELAYEVISNLVNYLDANQGGLFIYNDNDPDNIYLELFASFAYSRKKFLEKTIALGEGLIGTCAQEKATILLDDIPNNYIEVTSGLGEANPNSLIIVPLKIEDEIFGIIEIASFNKFEIHQVDFIEKIAESIASTLSSVQVNIKTAALLEQSQQQAEEMAAQEEEMRQNMEELQATQEESARREEELTGLMAVMENSFYSAQIDLQGSIIHANNRLLNLYGMSSSEAVGMHIKNIVKDDRGESKFDQIWHSVSNGQNYIQDVESERDGKKYKFKEYFMPVLDQNDIPMKVLYIAFDI